MTAWIADTDIQAWIGADQITLDAAGSLAQTATDCVQALIERDLSLQGPLTEVYSANGASFILLNSWPIRQVTSVSYNNQPVQPAANQQPGWMLDRFNTRKLAFHGMGRLPNGMLNVTVAYSGGYDIVPLGEGSNLSPLALPGGVSQALRLTAAAIFNSQAADPNLSSESTAGVFSGSFYATGVGAVPPGARTLLNNYMRASP